MKFEFWPNRRGYRLITKSTQWTSQDDLDPFYFKSINFGQKIFTSYEGGKLRIKHTKSSYFVHEVGAGIEKYRRPTRKEKYNLELEKARLLLTKEEK